MLPTLPARTDQARLVDAGRVRFVAGVQAHANGWHCYAGCPRWMGCDCPPHQYLSNAPRRRR